MENGVEKNISKESVSKVVTLSREISRIKVLDDKSPEANERARNFLMANFPAKYESVERMIELSQDPGRKEDDVVKKNAKESLDLLGSAVLLAGQDKKIESWIEKGDVSAHLPPNFTGIEIVLENNLFVSGEKDETGKEIVKQLSVLEKANRRAEFAPNSYAETKEKETKKTIDALLDKYDSVDSDSEDARKLGAVVGSLDDSLSNEPIEKLNVSPEKIIEDLDKKNSLDKKQLDNLNLEKDDEMREKLSKNTENAGVGKGLEAWSKAKQSEKSPRNREKELPDGGIDALYKMIDFIEQGTSSVDDLSRNSEYYRVLYQVQNGVFDDQLKKEEYGGKILEKEGLDVFKEEIAMRMFLHGSYLASSKCKSIEDILRVIGTTHEGDINKDIDRNFVSFFLKERAGLKKLPINKAWDLRQEGYFKVFDFKKKIWGDSKEFLAYLTAKKKGDDDRNEYRKKLYDSVMKKGGLGVAVGLTKEDITIFKDEKYGILTDVYKNYLQIEKSGGLEADVIKEYMIWKMKIENDCSDMDAQKAFDLAQKFSVATFADSKADLNFSADDYAELILFKYLRYSDGPNRNSGRMGKSKGIGAANTIKHVDALTCHWLDLSRKGPKEGAKREIISVYSPLYTKDINFTKIAGNSDMAYHFGGVVSSQVLAVQEAFYDKISPKDVLSFNYLNKLFAKINKTTYDMCKAGIAPIFYENRSDFDKVYAGLAENWDKSEQGEFNKGKAEAKVAEKMRKAWLINLFELAGINSSGWTNLDLKNFQRSLYRNQQLYDENGNPGASFIPISEIHDAMKRTKVLITVRDNDQERKNLKRRDTY